MMKINTRFYQICFLLFLTFSARPSLYSQISPMRLVGLIQETNALFLNPYAQGIYLSPYGMLQFHRDREIKNVAWVDSYWTYVGGPNRRLHDTVFTEVLDNQTIVHNPDDRFNSRTYEYDQAGYLTKRYRGKHPDDIHRRDEDSFLIQQGFGGELQRAERQGNTFFWYNVASNRLDYSVRYNAENRPASVKFLGHYFGPGVAWYQEDYTWEGARLTSSTQIREFENGSRDTAYIQWTYDDFGLIESIRSKKVNDFNWQTIHYQTQVTGTAEGPVSITISNDEVLLLALTFDHRDNLIELKKPQVTKRRVIKYRKKERRK
ncbi:MAG: hypothetical protein AAGH79_11085 [Bacteroidota bacterium]